ncbi:MAG: hypothetical protein EA411_02350 [Saprospirales bacterium]|nr:MAG: hypothetical protein EA411_02350 [Saprospirales bacterium]
MNKSVEKNGGKSGQESIATELLSLQSTLLVSLVFMLFTLLLSACSVEEEELRGGLPKHAWEKIDDRIEAFEARRQRECRERALETALFRVDSTLLEMESLIPIDTTGGIIRPVRPERPKIREKRDTTPIRPFIEFQSEDNSS